MTVTAFLVLMDVVASLAAIAGCSCAAVGERAAALVLWILAALLFFVTAHYGI
jgi:hypothetical protein